jgi:hypothetical protein
VAKKKNGAKGKRAGRRPPGRTPSLSPQMKRFTEEYCANGFRGPDAARAAGYTSEGGALRSQVYKLLKNPLVRAAVDARLAELEEDARTRTGAIVERLAEVATFDPGEVLDFTGLELRIKPGMLISEAARRCIKKIAFDPAGRPQLQFHDRVRADELLGKYRRMFVDRVEVRDSTLEDLLDAAEGADRE